MRILRETLTLLEWNRSRAVTELGPGRIGLHADFGRDAIAEPGKPARKEEV